MRNSRYILELGIVLAAYLVTLAVTIVALDHAGLPPLWRQIVTLLPVVPCLAFCWVIVRQFRRLDEMCLRMQAEALMFSFALTALLTFSYGFLEIAGAPHISMFAVWPLMAVFWMLGLFFTSRRYR